MLGKFKIGPIILVILGAIFLLNNFDILPWSIWNNLWKFWPLIIILIGVEYLIGHTISLKTAALLLVIVFLIPLIIAFNPFTNNPLSSEKINIKENLDAITKAKIIVELPASNLKIDNTKMSDLLVEGQITYSKASTKPIIDTQESFDQKIVKIFQKSEAGIPFISSLKNNTNLLISPQIPIEIQVKTEATKQYFDLKDLRIDYLEIESKASDIKIDFGQLYSTRVKINSTASNINLKIPKNIEARIQVDSKVKNVRASKKFQEDSGVYKSSGFDKSFTRIDIQIESVAGTINIH